MSAHFVNPKQSDWISCYVRAEFMTGLISLQARKPNFDKISTSSYKSLVLFLNIRKWTQFGNFEMLGTWVNFNFWRSELFVHESFTCYWQGKQPDRHEERELLFFYLSKYTRNEKRSREETFDVTGARHSRVRFCFSSHMTGYKQPILPCYSTLTAFKIFLCLYNFPIEKATRYTSEIASKEPNVCKKIILLENSCGR